VDQDKGENMSRVGLIVTVVAFLALAFFGYLTVR
jgi:hypothetical protein